MAMDNFVNKYFTRGAVGEDIYGESFAAREIVFDP